MAWLIILGGSVSFQGRVLAKIRYGDLIQFDVARPYERDDRSFVEVIPEHLKGATGFLEFPGGVPDDLLHAIREQQEVTLTCVTPTGEVEADIRVDGGFLTIPDAIIELIPFTVTGDVGFTTPVLLR